MFTPRSIGIILLFALPDLGTAQEVLVKSGDSLSSIAKREFGNGNRWVELCEINKEMLKGCDNLPTGATIKLARERRTSGDAVQAEADVIGDQSHQKATPRPAHLTAGVEVISPRENLIDVPTDIGSDYWLPYFAKPVVVSGIADPVGAYGAVSLTSTDSASSPDGSYSGFVREGRLEPGAYTVGVWLRSDEPVSLTAGISDANLYPEQLVPGKTWKYFQFTITTSDPTDRVFQMFEHSRGNSGWELYGISVERELSEAP